jgi:hypothetical protein
LKNQPIWPILKIPPQSLGRLRAKITVPKSVDEV